MRLELWRLRMKKSENGWRGVRSASIEGQDGSGLDLDPNPNGSQLFKKTVKFRQFCTLKVVGNQN
jgi:hypothetical protein